MERRHFAKKTLGAALALTAASACTNDKSPAIPVTTINLLEAGAVTDGSTVCTEIIQSSIDKLASAGGGKLIFPPGKYISGTVHLKDNITFDIQPGAILMGSPNIDDYPILDRENPQIDDQQRHLIYADGVKNICLTGGGEINGNGPEFWEDIEEERTWIPAKPERVNPMIKFDNCTQIRINNLLIGNSPGWTVNLFKSSVIFIDGVQILNNIYGPNCDGFDLDGCRDVVINNCQIECGDDAICLKTTEEAQSTERISITNCIIRTNCAAFRIGAESWHDFRQITFSNSVVHQSSRAVDIAMIDGATVEDISVSNLTIDTNCGITMNRAIHLELRKSRGDWNGNIEAEKAGKMRRILISNINLTTDGRILLTAADGGVLENIALSNINIKYPWIEDPYLVKDKSDPYQSSNYNPRARIAKAAVVVENAENFQLHNLTIQWPEGEVPKDFLSKKEGDEIIFDPANEEYKTPVFHAFWGREIHGGLLDMPLARGIFRGTKSIHLERCDVIVR